MTISRRRERFAAGNELKTEFRKKRTMKKKTSSLALGAAFAALAAVAAESPVPVPAMPRSSAADAMAQVKTTQWIEEALPRKWAEISKDESSAADKAKALQEEAIKSGYYLTRIEEKDGEIVSKPGTFGEIAVKFRPTGTNTAETAEGRYFSAKQIKEKLAKHGVAEGRPFNYYRLYDAFKELNADPDIQANVRLVQPSDGDDRSLAVNVDVEEERPLHLVATVDNFGTGPDHGDYAADKWMARGTAQYLNLWRAGHAVTANGFTSLDNTLWGGSASYYAPFSLGNRDASLTLHGGFSELSADDVVPNIDVEGQGWFFGAQASVDLVPSWEDSLRFALGLTWRRVWDQLVLHDDGKTDKLNRNSVELMPLSAALVYTSAGIDSWIGRNYATLEVSHDVGADEKELKRQRFTAEEDYTIVRAQLARIQALGTPGSYAGRNILFGRVETQWSDSPLVSAEQMGVGGALSVRGYKEREHLGDHAAVASVEWRTPLLLGYLGGGREGETARDRLQLVLFGDAGWFKIDEPIAGQDDDDDLLASVGAGLRFAWGDNALLRFDWGFPLKETDDSDRSGRGHVMLQAQF